MASRHFEAVTSRSDGGFCVASSALTGNMWNGSLWYFDSWEHYKVVPNMDMYGVSTTDGIADIKWYNDTNLLVGSDSGHVEVWSLVSPGNELENNNVLDLYHDGMVLCISITCDGENGRCILSGGGDGRINVYDLKNEKTLKSFQGHVGWITSLDSHPTQSNVFVSVGMDATMKVWDIRQNNYVQNICPDNLSLHGNFQSLSWSQESIVTGSETGYVALYDSRNLVSPLINIKPHTQSVNRVLLSPTLKGIIVSVSDDCSMKLYDSTTQQFVYHNTSHNDFVRGLSWQTDTYLLTCGWDGLIYRHCVKDWLANNNNLLTKIDDVIMEHNGIGKENHCMNEEDTMIVNKNNLTTLNGLNRDNILEKK